MLAENHEPPPPAPRACQVLGVWACSPSVLLALHKTINKHTAKRCNFCFINHIIWVEACAKPSSFIAKWSYHKALQPIVRQKYAKFKCHLHGAKWLRGLFFEWCGFTLYVICTVFISQPPFAKKGEFGLPLIARFALFNPYTLDGYLLLHAYNCQRRSAAINCTLTLANGAAPPLICSYILVAENFRR